MSYANTALLLPLSGADAGTSFPDYSRHDRTVTAFGNAQTSTAQSQFYGSSGLFDGTGDYLTCPQIDLTQQSVFTLRCWVRAAAIGATMGVFSTRSSGSNDGAVLRINTDGTVMFFYTGSSQRITTATVSATTWTHLEIVRDGGTLYQYIGGVLDGSGAFSNGTQGSTLSHIGVSSAALGDGFNGHIQDLKIIVGTALHTANFTPPGKLIGTLSNTGTGGEPVKDDTGTAASRTIIAVPRSYSIAPPRGFLATSDGSGKFSLDVPNGAEFSDLNNDYTVIALDDAAGTQYNDLILGRVTPA